MWPFLQLSDLKDFDILSIKIIYPMYGVSSFAKEHFLLSQKKTILFEKIEKVFWSNSDASKNCSNE